MSSFLHLVFLFNCSGKNFNSQYLSLLKNKQKISSLLNRHRVFFRQLGKALFRSLSSARHFLPLPLASVKQNRHFLPSIVAVFFVDKRPNTSAQILQQNVRFVRQLTPFQPFWQLVCSDCNHLLPNNITAFNAKNMPCVTRQNVLQKNTFYFWQLTAFQPFCAVSCTVITIICAEQCCSVLTIKSLTLHQ